MQSAEQVAEAGYRGLMEDAGRLCPGPQQAGHVR